MSDCTCSACRKHHGEKEEEQTAFLMGMAASAVLPAIQLMTASVQSSSERYFSAIRQSQNVASTDLTLVTASALKILGEANSLPTNTKRSKRETETIFGLPPGAPVVT